MHRMDFLRARISVCSKSAIVFGLGLLALLVPAAPAQTVVSQGPLNYFQNYFVTGDYAVGGVGGLSTKGQNPTAIIPALSVPCTTGPGLSASVVPCTAKGALPADIIAAFLYWQTTETSATPIATTGTFDANLSNPNASPFNPNLANEPMVGTPLGSPQIPACVAGGGTETKNSFVRVYRADVLPYLSLNSTANVRTANYTHTIAFTGGTGTTFNGATLVVVYRLVVAGSPRIAPLRSVVIYDGSFTGVASRSASLNQTMGGFYEASTSPNARMTHIVGGGQKGFAETLTVNGSIPQGVPSNPFVGAQGADWDNYTFNYNLGSKAASVVTEVQSSNDCLSWGAIITSTNVLDSDFDGLLDVWETSGLYFNPGVRNDGVVNQTTTAPAVFGPCTASNLSTCLDLPLMGAKPTVPDIFIQVDWMASSGLSVPNHSHIPQYAALNMVGTVFQSHGINMHFDVGNNYQGQSFIVPTAYAKGGNVVQESSVLCIAGSTTCNFWPQSEQYSVLGWKAGFGSIKDGDTAFPSPPGPVGGLQPLFPLNRKDSVHYALFAHAIAASTPLSAPEAGSISGVGDLPGGDFMVTLGLWRSDNPAVDQIGTVLQEAGTIMHELGHNLDLHHGGWNNTPICMPDYPSVMNYLYQVAGLTDSKGTEHIDYSYGLELPMSENFLSSLIPMGLQGYKVRYYGPFNSNPSSPLVNTPGQATKVFCSGDLLNTGAISNEGQYVLLQGANVSTPDWSNGTVTLGKLITSGLDINFDGTGGQTFTDSPDWLSLNLQQVSARPNAFAASSDLGRSDGGTSDLGRSDGGTSDLGRSDGGTSQLGADASGDLNYAAFVVSGGLLAPTGVTVAVTPPASTSSGYAGGTGNTLNWVGNTGVASQYNVYRCNGSAGACTPAAPPLTGTGGVSSGSPVITTYTDAVNDFVHAGSTCPAASTCYNTTYYYYVTEVNQVNLPPGAACSPTTCIETGASSTVNSQVTHMTVVANSQTVTYGAAKSTTPTLTYTVYSNAAAATSLAGVTCAYTTPPPANANGYYDAGNYNITCTGLSAVPNTTEGITYYTAASLPLLYPANLGGTVAGITQGTLTVNQLPITVTAVCSTKVYNANTNAGTVCTPANSATIAVPTITTNTLVSGDTAGFTESYSDNPNVGSTHVMAPAGTVNDNNGGANYKVTFVNSPGTSVITPAPLTIKATTNTKTYDSTTSAAAIPTTSVPCGMTTVTGPPTLCGSDTITSLTEAYSSPNAGNSVPITVSTGYVIGDGNGGNNYTVTKIGTTGVINQAPVTTTAGSYSGTYNGMSHSPSGCTVTPTTPPSTFVGTVTCTNNPASFGPNVGSGTVNPVAAVGASDFLTNYVVTSVNGSWAITPAPVTATAGSYSGTYNGAAQSPSACAVTPNAPNTFTGSLTCTNSPASVGPNVGSGTVSPTPAVGAGNSVTNYAITSVSGSSSIVKANATIMVTPYNVTYNGNPQTAAGTAMGVEATPANLSSELNLSGTNHTNAGTYPSDPWTFIDTTGNYNNASGAVSDIINQAIPQVSDSGPLPSPPDYYGQPVTLTVTVAPPASGEVPTGTVTFSFALNSTTYYICSDGSISTTLTPLCIITGTFNGTNYVASVTTSKLPTAPENVLATYSGDTNFLGEAATQPVSVTVSQASSAVTLTKSNDPTTYGTPVSLTVNVADATGGSSGVPTGTVTLSFKLDPTDPNGQVYNICVDGSVITTPCANPITLGTDPMNPTTVTVQNIALPAGLATFANPGTTPPAQYSYPINATYSGDTNFAAPSAPVGLSQTVNPAPVTVTAGSYSGTYNGTAQSLSSCTVMPTPTNPPSTFIGTVTCTNNITMPVGPGAGSGTVTPVPAVGAGDSLNNYAITSMNGSWTIAKANATIMVVPYNNVTYNGSPYTATGSATGVNNTNLASELNLNGTAHVNAGTYSSDPWTFTDNTGNYNNASGTVADAIGQYPLTVTATGVNKTFDGTTNATVTLSDNRITGDNSINDSYMSASFVNAGPGTGITVNVNGISISGAGMGNYSLQNTTATTTANISSSINLSALSLNGKNYSTNSAALPVWTGSALQLTNGTDETVSAWLGTAIPVSSAFSSTFEFQITPKSTSATSIGDGFAFVIQADPAGGVTSSDPGGASALGSTGYGMYIGYAGIPNSIAIEFDTYQNAGNTGNNGYGDPNSPHIGIQSLGTLANTPNHNNVTANLAGPTPATFADGGTHYATIVYDGSSTIRVYLDFASTAIVGATFTGGLDTLLGLNGGPAYVGFTSATGGAQENSDILSWTWTWNGGAPPAP